MAGIEVRKFRQMGAWGTQSEENDSTLDLIYWGAKDHDVTQEYTQTEANQILDYVFGSIKQSKIENADEEDYPIVGVVTFFLRRKFIIKSEYLINALKMNKNILKSVAIISPNNVGSLCMERSGKPCRCN